ncbi:hypothetical protein [Paenibacillus xylaniclasticus]|uniref:hypothetical protein n=1 Tax=Paenibacillus xylaniclasticus TaxID=588083 RepID=UPI000FD7C526|nr:MULTISPECIES: hypothetical protein [Paenibacillus]GFN32541.1 hypothetical protein PCURB6_28010 [Paenibacillus curdlanolyticus]
MKQWNVISRHKWVAGAVITESYNENNSNVRRFTATIRGWRNFKIFEGEARPNIRQEVMNKVVEIRDRIDSGDETVFEEDTIIKDKTTCNKDILKRKIIILENKLITALELAKESLIIISKDNNINIDIVTVLSNSADHIKVKGKFILSEIINKIDLKNITNEHAKDLLEKIDGYIRITERKYIDKKMNLKRIELIGVWAREAMVNLERDLRLDELKDRSNKLK